MGTDRTGLRLSSTPVGPQRTCVGCRQTDSRSELVRVVLTGKGSAEMALTLDVKKSLSGRGAWLHRRSECFALAVRRHAFGRAVRATARLDTVALAAEFDLHSILQPSIKGTESGFDADEHPMSTQR